MMDFSTKNDATLNVYIHLENEAYTLFNGILMNLHILPYTARTNSALTKAVDQLIQQTVFSPVANSIPAVPLSVLGILSPSSCNVESVALPDQNGCINIGPLSMPAAPIAPPDQDLRIHVEPLSTPALAHCLPLHSSAHNVTDNPSMNVQAHVDHVTP